MWKHITSPSLAVKPATVPLVTRTFSSPATRTQSHRWPTSRRPISFHKLNFFRLERIPDLPLWWALFVVFAVHEIWILVLMHPIHNVAVSFICGEKAPAIHSWDELFAPEVLKWMCTHSLFLLLPFLGCSHLKQFSKPGGTRVVLILTASSLGTCHCWCTCWAI